MYYIHADHLNTPRVIVNTANTIVWRWENTHAFGANLPDEDPDGNAQLFEYNPRFLGQYFDKETNLHYNYFRYYEPETGRYISPDPIGLAGSINFFRYASSNSMTFVDSLGLNPLIGAEIDTAILPGVGTATGAILGSVSVYLMADKLGNIILAKPKPDSKPKNCPAGTKPID